MKSSLNVKRYFPTYFYKLKLLQKIKDRVFIFVIFYMYSKKHVSDPNKINKDRMIFKKCIFL